MSNNAYNDAKGSYSIKPVTLEVVDQAIVDYFDKRLSTTVDTERGRVKVPVIFASGERWKLIRDNKGLRDENGTLILPLISVRRTNIDRTPGQHALAQETSHIVVRKEIHAKTANMQTLVKARQTAGFPESKREPVYEYLTIPFPDFATVYYEIIIWTQYQTQMNEVLEKIFYNYDHMDSFVMPVEYDGHKRKGNSYYFVGFRDGSVVPQSNVEEFTNQERIIKYSYSIRVPAYFMLDPKDESLAYGRNKSESPSDDGSKVTIKHQNATDVKLKESVLSLEEFEKLFG
jgi:hypothetical protein